MKKRDFKPVIFFAFALAMTVLSLFGPKAVYATTKLDILDKIPAMEQSSTEYKTDTEIKTLLQDISTAINQQLTVNIKDFGAIGNGFDSDVAALKKAIDYLSAKGGGNIFFPATAQSYVLDQSVVVSRNINLVGERTNIGRYFDFQTDNCVLHFMGNNVVKGFIYDGGLTRIPNVGVPYEYTRYKDFAIHNEGVIFYNNVFLNAKGSFIGGFGNTIIYNNTFGDYGDHCTYMDGSSKLTSRGEDYARNVIISNNTFTSLTATRDAVKFRNGGENIIISNNTFDLPNGVLFTFYLGDSLNPQGNLKNISFSYNSVKSCTNVGAVGVYNIPVGSTLGILDDIKISNNIFESCNGYLQIGGEVWAASTNMDYFNGSTINITGNTFKATPPQIHMGARGNGLEVNISNNKVYGIPRNNSFIALYGNVSLTVENNELAFANNSTLIISPYALCRSYNATTAGIKATANQTINIKGNTISGVRKVYEEYSGKGVTYLTDKETVVLINNKFKQTGLPIIFGMDAGLSSLIKANFEISGNTSTLDGSTTSILFER